VRRFAACLMVAAAAEALLLAYLLRSVGLL
jgi:hypothetical protein